MTEQPQRRTRLAFVIAPLVIFASVALMFAFALQKGDPSKLPSTFIGKPAPALNLPPVDGLTSAGKPVPGLAATDLKTGKPSVVNFFASWCVPCVQEHPVLVQLKRQTGVTLYGINYKDPPPGGRRFLGRYGNPYDAVGADDSGRAGIDWGVYGMPETFVLDGAGRIVYKHIGPISPRDLQSKIIPALEKAGRKSAVPGK